LTIDIDKLGEAELADLNRRIVERLRLVLACCVPLTGSSSDSNPATLPNGAKAVYWAVT